jgi:RNA polymerase sigma-70 factor, ECF subfamily
MMRASRREGVVKRGASARSGDLAAIDSNTPAPSVLSTGGGRDEERGRNRAMTLETREAWWVLRAQGGDREAFDALLAAVQEPLFGFVAAVTRDRTLAEDVLQEVFVRIYTGLRWLREPALFRPWAYRIAAREALRHSRRAWRRETLHEGDDALERLPADEVEPPDPWLLERLPGLLDEVSPASRAVLTLHYLHELSLSETAAVLGIPPGTARSRLAYGLRSLRAALGVTPTTSHQAHPTREES